MFSVGGCLFLEHAITFHSRIRHICSSLYFHLHSQTSTCGISLIKKKKFLSVTEFSRRLRASDPGSKVEEGMEGKKVMVVVVGKRKTGKEGEKNAWRPHVLTNIVC